jgi:hypothetical protein
MMLTPPISLLGRLLQVVDCSLLVLLPRRLVQSIAFVVISRIVPHETPFLLLLLLLLLVPWKRRVGIEQIVLVLVLLLSPRALQALQACGFNSVIRPPSHRPLHLHHFHGGVIVITLPIVDLVVRVEDVDDFPGVVVLLLLHLVLFLACCCCCCYCTSFGNRAAVPDGKAAGPARRACTWLPVRVWRGGINAWCMRNARSKLGSYVEGVWKQT